MHVEIDTPGLQQLLARGDVQLLEVLADGAFEMEHMPGARSVPLADLTEERVVVLGLEHEAPTVVYGFDAQDDRASRAAHRLVAMGFTAVHLYVPGKVAWLAAGLPGEGRRKDAERIGAIADADVPIIPDAATVGDAVEILAGASVGVVLHDSRIVIGIILRSDLDAPRSTPVADVVRPGPSTFRPSMTIDELVAYFEKTEEKRAIVSTATGEWIGLIRRTDVLGPGT